MVVKTTIPRFPDLLFDKTALSFDEWPSVVGEHGGCSSDTGFSDPVCPSFDIVSLDLVFASLLLADAERLHFKWAPCSTATNNAPHRDAHLTDTI